jgi:acyl-coenzyme A thioesterase PaaI-like protein
MNDKPTATETAAFDPARAGWKVIKQNGFGHLAGPIWRHGDAEFGFLVEAKHMNFADIVHGGMLATLADQAMGMTALRAHRQQAACDDRTEHAIRRRGADWRIRRGPLRSRADNARHHLHAVQTRGRHARSGERDGYLEDQRGRVASCSVLAGRRPRLGCL